MQKEISSEEKLNRWEDLREIKNLVGRMSTDYLLKKEGLMVENYWSTREDICLGTNNGYFYGKDHVKRYFDAEASRIRKESAFLQKLFPAELGELSEKQVHGIGMIDYKPVDTAVIEIAADRKTAKGIWMIRGSYSKLTNAGPIAYWEWSWLAIDFVREDSQWRIWHNLYLREIDRPCGYSFTDKVHEFPMREEFADWEEPEATLPNIPCDLHPLYAADRPFTKSPQLPQPYETFATTFSYGYSREEATV